MVEASRFEPDVLRIGKAFGQHVAIEYPKGMIDGSAATEVSVPAVRRRYGRIDLLIEADDSGRPLLVVVEVKNTDWDARAHHRVMPNLSRHARQVWNYLEALIPRLDAGGLQAALVYPHRPSQPGRAEIIERKLDSLGISVVFYDEL
jgi:hypothetical protein